MANLLRLLALATMAVIVAACGSSAGASATPPPVNFVGNSTCDTSSSSAYGVPNVNSLPPVGEEVDEMPHMHVAEGTKITYTHNPPTSGCHYNLGYGRAPITAGAYDRSVPNEYWVHNLEHGYIVVLYDCPAGCDQQFQALRNWAHGLPHDSGVSYAKVLILPYSGMQVPFAVVSWDWYDPMPTFNINEVQRFYANHTGHGPEQAGP